MKPPRAVARIAQVMGIHETPHRHFSLQLSPKVRML